MEFEITEKKTLLQKVTAGKPVAGAGSATVTPSSSSAGGGTPGASRFTTDEKDILYALFHEHEDAIDIKFRKCQKNKISVRDAWSKIVEEYNSNPNIVTHRNLKQIQKFWLNARLRKQYPFRTSGLAISSATTVVTKKHQPPTLTVINPVIPIPLDEHEQVKHEPGEVHVVNEKIDDTLMSHESDYEEVILPNSVTSDHHSHMVESPPTYTTLQTQQISVDQISAEKLTLNDLLQFKKSRPREEIILQLKNTTENQFQLPTLQPAPMNPVNSQYKHHQIIHETHHQQTQPQIQIQQHTPTQQQHHVPPPSPTYCTYTVHNPPQQIAQNIELYDDKLNYFRLKEAELKYKEEQISLEQKKIALARSQEELKHMRELQRLQIEEMKIKIRLLHEQEKQLKK